MHGYIKPSHPVNYFIDLFNFKSVVKYAAAAGKKLKIVTRSRRFIDSYTCYDTTNSPVILSAFWLSGGLIYSRSGYNITTYSHDDVLSMEVI